MQSNPRVVAALVKLFRVLQKKGFMEPGNASPPSPMKMLRMMGDAEVNDAAAELQRVMCAENIEFSAANLMALLRARGSAGGSAWMDRVREMGKSGDSEGASVSPSTNDQATADKPSSLFGGFLSKFKSGSK
ncbi:hypothetical protein IWQ57_002314 [Coemansia nantahalensis]|nr:hypothetical protein IWQ57_002314 [Coemansia nantahalensis]